MPTSDESWSPKLRTVGDLERRDHSYLTDTDKCAFFGEYTRGRGFGYSRTNNLVSNLKKSPDRRNTPEWKYKLQAIKEAGEAFAANINPQALGCTAFVPIPPSKPTSSPLYDDRIAQVARAISSNVDVREVLHTLADREPAHLTSNARDPVALRATIGIKNELLKPAPRYVVLLDDLLTTGCSFKVCKEILAKVWPTGDISGIFVARRVIPCPFEAVDLV
jgi:hypothetical protein